MSFNGTRSGLVVAVAASMLLAGCSSTSSNPKLSAQTGVPTPASALDTVKWNVQGEPRTLDPTQDVSQTIMPILSNICEPLLQQAAGPTITDGLASVAQPDATTYVYTINKHATFASGAPVTADDVVYSLKRNQDPAVGSQFATYFANVKSIDATLTDEVTVKLTRPDVVFNEMMSSPAAMILQKSAAEAAGKKLGTPTGALPCSGRYTLASWDPGKSITITRNPNYWGGNSSTVSTKNVVFSFLSTDTTITNALLDGSIDGTFDVPYSTLARLQNSSNGKLYQGSTYEQFQLVFWNVSSGPLADPRLRRALQLAIDYDGIQKTILHSDVPAPKAVAARGTYGYAKSTFDKAYDALPAAKQNLDQAKALVAAAGAPTTAVRLPYPTGFDFETQGATAVQQAGKQIGIDIQLEAMPLADWLNIVFNPQLRAKYAMSLQTNYSYVPDPLQVYLEYYTPGASLNQSGYQQSNILSLLDQARATADPETRATIVAKAQTLMAEDPILISLGEMGGLAYVNNHVAGVTPDFFRNFSPWAAQMGGS